MTNIEIIEKLRMSTFVDEDDNEYTLDFKPPLTAGELQALEARFPAKQIPAELQEILRVTKGWEGGGIDSAFFDSIGEFGSTELLPYSIALGHDGFGNFWVLELKDNGDTGKIFFACHDPAVFVIYAGTLNEYLQSLVEFFENPGDNYLDNVHEKVVMDIWDANPNTIDIAGFRKSNVELNTFLAEFAGDDWIVADLRQARNKDGFAWGRYGSNEFTRKHPTEAVWVLKKKAKGFLSKLFGK